MQGCQAHQAYLTQRSYGMMEEASVGDRYVPPRFACDIFLTAVHGACSLLLRGLVQSTTGLGQDPTKVDVMLHDRFQQ